MKPLILSVVFVDLITNFNKFTYFEDVWIMQPKIIERITEVYAVCTFVFMLVLRK